MISLPSLKTPRLQNDPRQAVGWALLSFGVAGFLFFFFLQVNRELVGNELTEFHAAVSIPEFGASLCFPGLNNLTNAYTTYPKTGNELFGHLYYKDNHPTLANYTILWFFSLLRFLGIEPMPSHLRWLGLICGLGTLLCTFLLIRQILSKNSQRFFYGSLAVMLCATNPLFIQSQLYVTREANLVFLFAAFYVTYLRFREKVTFSRTAIFVAICLLLFGSKFTTPICLFPVVFLDGCVSGKKNPWFALAVMVLTYGLAILFWKYYWSIRGVEAPMMLRYMFSAAKETMGVHGEEGFSPKSFFLGHPVRSFGILPIWFGFGISMLLIATLFWRIKLWWRSRSWEALDVLVGFVVVLILLHLGKYQKIYPPYQADVVCAIVVAVVAYLAALNWHVDPFLRKVPVLIAFVGIQLLLQLSLIGRDPVLDPASLSYHMGKIAVGSDFDYFNKMGIGVMRLWQWVVWLLPLLVVWIYCRFLKMSGLGHKTVLTFILFAQTALNYHTGFAQALATYNPNAYYLTPAVKDDRVMVDIAKDIIRAYPNRQRWYISGAELGTYLYFVDHKWIDFIDPMFIDEKTLTITWTGDRLREFSGLQIERDFTTTDPKKMFAIKRIGQTK